MPRPFISLLTDFGARDPSAAICHGVIRSIAPEAEVLDISHEVRKYAIRDGALLLWCALPYLPVGQHVAVVDPGVGTARRPVAVRTSRGDHLIGPDNGLLSMAIDRLGAAAAVALEAEAYRLPVVSSSFHGRDIFAPAAAHLALGVALEQLGPAIDPAGLVALPLPAPRIAGGALETHILYVDTFGNVKLTALAPQLHEALADVEPGTPLDLTVGEEARELRVGWHTTFGSAGVGEPLLYEDSYGRLCLAVNQGDAAAELQLREDLAVTIRRAR